MKYRLCVLAPVCLALQVVTAQSLITEDPADPDGPSVSVAADLLVGDSAQPQDLHVHGDTLLDGDLGLNGTLSIGNTTTGTPASGAIRWTGSDFEGYNGTVWKSLTKTNNGSSSSAWGYNNQANGISSTVWGSSNQANGGISTAWGQKNHTNGSLSTAWGYNNQADGGISTAWGYNNQASGFSSSAWGSSNQADGPTSTAWGSCNQANGSRSTVWGYNNQADGDYSTAWGEGNLAESVFSTVMGRYNIGGVTIIDDDNAYNDGDRLWFETDPLFEIGAGRSWARANALTVLKDGRVAIGKHYTLPNSASEDLQVQGSIKLGSSSGPPSSGAIRWTGSDFEGYKGEDDGWVSLTTPSPSQANVKAALGVDANANVLTASANGQVSLPSSLTVSTKVAAKVGNNKTNTPGIFTAGEHWGLDSSSSYSLFVSESFGHPTYQRNPSQFGFLYSISSDNEAGPSEPGLVLYNNHAVAGAWSPLIAFGNREVGNTPYNSATAGIAARTPQANTSDGHWIDGELYFFTSGDSTHGLRKRVVIDKDGNLGVGVFSLTERLHVDGALVLGDTATTTPGAIRYNNDDADFQGYKGEDDGWVSLTTPDVDTVQSASSLVVPGSTTAKLSVDANGRILLDEAQGDISMGRFTAN